MNQRPLPEGYEVRDDGYIRKLYKGTVLLAVISEYNPPNFRSENYIMSIYESADWKALEVFNGNYWREMRARKLENRADHRKRAAE